MSRGLDRDDERPAMAGQARQAGNSFAAPSPASRVRIPRRTREERRERVDERRPAPLPLPSGARRAVVVHAGRAYPLRGSESRTLDTLGTFRVVLTRDLTAAEYGGHRTRADQDLRSLQAQGLIERRTIASDRVGHSEEFVTLTSRGRALLEAHRGPSQFSSETRRPVYAGWAKPRELVHDASLYRMFQLEAERIAAAGGTIQRVALDDELKRDLYATANREDHPSAAARQARLVELARDEGLPVIDGHVLLPDLRIEYETATGERARVDLELATDHYHAGQLSAKGRAGFTVYSAAGHAARGIRSLRTTGARAASFDPHHLSGLLSL